MNKDKSIMAFAVFCSPLVILACITVLASFVLWTVVLPSFLLLRIFLIFGIGLATYFWLDTDEDGYVKEGKAK